MKYQPPLSPVESLDIITNMIQQAKGNVQRNTFFFLLWGWVIVIANLGMYSLSIIGYRYPYVVWAITVPAWLYTLWKTFSRSNETISVSHLDRISGWLWISYGVTLALVVAFGSKIGWNINPVILLMTAIPTFVTGIILRFRPLILGSIAFWALGILCFLVSRDQQQLVGATAIVLGYLIPGYMLRSKNAIDV